MQRRRVLAGLVIGWALGFVWFATSLPQPLAGGTSDGIVVLTGGEGRIGRGLDRLRAGAAKRMLVSGVDHEVKPVEFAVEYKVEPALMACCITLGYRSVDTRSNAQETAQWIARQHFTSVRLVTTDWHMRRAAFELRQVVPASVKVLEDAVPSHPTWRALLLEYHKLIARRISALWGA